MGRPLLLDLFCGAGGCAVGYHRAGFDVVGVDHRPQPRYPFEFVQADAMTFPLDGFDAIHASPPCQRYSVARHSDDHPDLVPSVRDRLLAASQPWVIENVIGSPLVRPIILCGMMFGLKVYRHRAFESSLFLMQPDHPPHRESTGAHRGYSYRHPFVCVAGHNFHLAEGKAAMGIDWVKNRRELAQAIPPAYTEFIGKQLLRVVHG